MQKEKTKEQEMDTEFEHLFSNLKLNEYYSILDVIRYLHHIETNRFITEKKQKLEKDEIVSLSKEDEFEIFFKVKYMLYYVKGYYYTLFQKDMFHESLYKIEFKNNQVPEFNENEHKVINYYDYIEDYLKVWNQKEHQHYISNYFGIDNILNDILKIDYRIIPYILYLSDEKTYRDKLIEFTTEVGFYQKLIF